MNYNEYVEYSKQQLNLLNHCHEVRYVYFDLIARYDNSTASPAQKKQMRIELGKYAEKLINKMIDNWFPKG